MSIYEFTGRITYSDFVTAARETALMVLGRMGMSRIPLSVGAQGGDTAHVSFNGHTVELQLPSMDGDRIIPAELARRLLAYLVHELLHIAATPLDVMPERVRGVASAGGVNPADLMAVVNALEDYFIERIGTKPGASIVANAPALLGALNDTLFAQHIEGMSQGMTRKPTDAVTNYIGSQINRHGQQATPDLDAALDLHDPAASLDPKVKTAIHDALDALDRMADAGKLDDHISRDRWKRQFGERLKLAAQVLGINNANPPQQAQPSQQPQAQPSQQPQKGEGEGKGESEKDEKGEGKGGAKGESEGQDDADDSEGEGGGAGGDSGDGEGDGEAEGGESKSPRGKGEDKPETTDKPSSGKGGQKGGKASTQHAKPAPAANDPKARANALAELMPKVSQQERELAFYTPQGIASAANPNQAANSLRTGQNNAHAAARVQDVRRLADASRRGLMSVEKIEIERRLSTGRMDRRATVRASAGAPDVFTRRQHTPGVKTAVQIMIDGSGSMSTPIQLRTAQHAPVTCSRFDAVLGTAAVILPALERANAENAAAIFTGNSFVSGTHTTVGVVKRFSDRANTDRLLKEWGYAGCGGGTPMVLETRWAGRQLAERRNVQRRVCLWLIDGQPQERGGIVRAEMDRQRKRGIEHYGIGLQCDLSSIFPVGKWIEVQDMGKLPAAFEALLLGKVRK